MDSQKIYEILKPRVKFEREEFWVVGLDLKKEVLFCELLFLGTLRKCKIYPREIFKLGFKFNADQLVIAHSHPMTAQVYPSRDDIVITKRLKSLGQTLDLEITDHLILNDKKYFSFYDEGFF